MTDEVLRDREQPGIGSAEASYGVTADPRQLLTGLDVGLLRDRVVCVGCGTQLSEGRAVTLYGYRPSDSLRWDVRRCYCVDCAPTTISEPTLGVTELLVRAWLGSMALPRTRTHRQCLTDVEVVAFSAPQEGASP